MVRLNEYVDVRLSPYRGPLLLTGLEEALILLPEHNEQKAPQELLSSGLFRGGWGGQAWFITSRDGEAFSPQCRVTSSASFFLFVFWCSDRRMRCQDATEGKGVIRFDAAPSQGQFRGFYCTCVWISRTGHWLALMLSFDLDVCWWLWAG